MPIYSFEGRVPRISPTAYVHPTAVVIGKVYIGEGCYIGPGAVLRGDWGEIVIREGSNVQDNVVIHARPEQVTYLGPDSHVGHAAVLHGCRLEGHVLVGMGSVINDDAVLEEGCVVASGAVVPPRMRVRSRSLVGGIPASEMGRVDEDRDALLWLGTRLYQTLPGRYRKSCSEIGREEAEKAFRAAPDPT